MSGEDHRVDIFSGLVDRQMDHCLEAILATCSPGDLDRMALVCQKWRIVIRAFERMKKYSFKCQSGKIDHTWMNMNPRIDHFHSFSCDCPKAIFYHEGPRFYLVVECRLGVTVMDAFNPHFKVMMATNLGSGMKKLVFGANHEILVYNEDTGVASVYSSITFEEICSKKFSSCEILCMARSRRIVYIVTYDLRSLEIKIYKAFGPSPCYTDQPFALWFTMKSLSSNFYLTHMASIYEDHLLVVGKDTDAYFVFNFDVGQKISERKCSDFMIWTFQEITTINDNIAMVKIRRNDIIESQYHILPYRWWLGWRFRNMVALISQELMMNDNFRLIEDSNIMVFAFKLPDYLRQTRLKVIYFDRRRRNIDVYRRDLLGIQVHNMLLIKRRLLLVRASKISRPGEQFIQIHLPVTHGIELVRIIRGHEVACDIPWIQVGMNRIICWNPQGCQKRLRILHMREELNSNGPLRHRKRAKPRRRVLTDSGNSNPRSGTGSCGPDCFFGLFWHITMRTLSRIRLALLTKFRI